MVLNTKFTLQSLCITYKLPHPFFYGSTPTQGPKSTCIIMWYEHFQMAVFPYFMTMQKLVIGIKNMKSTGVVSYVINIAIITVQQLSLIKV